MKRGLAKFSIVSVAFGDYDQFIPEFMKNNSKFSDDIIIEIERRPMGAMRNDAIVKAKYPYIVSLDIDDRLIASPDTREDFVGLGWVEDGKSRKYWLPGEMKSPANTIRSNIMFSKVLWEKVKFIDHDFYIYEFIRQAYLQGFQLAKTKNACVLYEKRNDSLSFNPTSQAHDQARVMYRKLLRTIK